MIEEKKNIADLSDEEFDKMSEEGTIKPETDKEEPIEESKEESKEKSKEDKSIEKESKEEPKEGEAKDDKIDEKSDKDKEDGSKISNEQRYNKITVPYSKLKKARDKVSERDSEIKTIKDEYESKIEDLQSKLEKSGNKDISGDIDKFTKDTGVDKSVVDGLLNIVKKHSGVSPDLEKRISAFEKKNNEATEELGFDKDFNSTAIPIIKEINKDVSIEQIDKVKSKVKEIAYKPENVNIPLAYILSHHKKEISELLEVSKGKKTSESSRPGSQANQKSIDTENFTPNDIKRMSDEEFDKFSEKQAKKSGGGFDIIRDGNKVN